MVGPHVTDMVEAGVVALDAETTIETVTDGMAPQPALSKAIKGAGLVALGRAIDLPNRKRTLVSTTPVAQPEVVPPLTPLSKGGSLH